MISYLRTIKISQRIFDMVMEAIGDKESGGYEIKGSLQTFNNCREQGYYANIYGNEKNEYKDLYEFVDIYPLSALKDNLKDLVKTIKKYLPNEGKIFEDDTVTNISTDFYISEIIRE